jgi:FkbM family methyltransferase
MPSFESIDRDPPSSAGALQSDLIFDVGMDACEDTAFYLKKGFRVVAVEANPAACAIAAERFPAEIAAGRLTVLNRAISADGEALRFYVCRTNSAWSTAAPRLRDQWVREGAVFDEVTVDGLTGADLIRAHGVPHYAKIDIEGLDLACLQGFRAVSARPRYVSVEVDFYAVDETIAELEGLGYTRFALVSQKGVPAQTPPVEPREGKAVEHRFSPFSSGLFGAELPARWGDGAQLRSQCRKVIWESRLSSGLGRLAALPGLRAPMGRLREILLPRSLDWYDIHATL